MASNLDYLKAVLTAGIITSNINNSNDNIYSRLCNLLERYKNKLIVNLNDVKKILLKI